jgi:hypothetical protein
MTTVDDFAQGILREYRAFAGQCAAIAAAPGAEETAAELYSMEDLPMIAARLRDFRARAEAAEVALAALAAMSLVCAHCGPESAGPAADNGRACATCYGTLILTDAAGAAELRRRYDDAVGEADGLAQARAEGEAAGAARERAAVVRFIRAVAAANGHSPLLNAVAADVASG